MPLIAIGSLLLAGIIAFSPAALARTEAIIYDAPNFQGRAVTLRHDTANFDLIGFNDKAASVYVMEGVWEFCTDGYYQGSCRQYSPGEYRVIGAQSDKISSARAVQRGGGYPSSGNEYQPSRDGYPPSGGHYPPPVSRPPAGDWNSVGRGEIVLYDLQDFRGRGITIQGTEPDFEARGFNDAAASMIVRRGTWQLCKDGQFRGDCRTYGPGEYRKLPHGHDDAYSSARPVDGGWESARGRGDRGPRIGLFERTEFGGRSIWLEHTSGDFENLGFNDRAESLLVEGGEWTLCSDSRGRGSCRTFGPGRYPSLPYDLRDRISSARVN